MKILGFNFLEIELYGKIKFLIFFEKNEKLVGKILSRMPFPFLI